MKCKICGIKDKYILNYLNNHIYPPDFVGFIINYEKSIRYIEFDNLENLLNINKKKMKFVAVMVDPSEIFLEKIKNLNFDYYQIYKLKPNELLKIKEKYCKKIISAITVERKEDVQNYKDYTKFSDIILFDSKGYEKSLDFDHSFLKGLPKSLNKMIAGNIKYNDKLDKFCNIADIIDISGGIETLGKKDISKIDFFLNNIKKINDKD